MVTFRRRFFVVVSSILVALSGALLTAACGGKTPTSPIEDVITSIPLEGIAETSVKVSDAPPNEIRDIKYGEEFPVTIHLELSDSFWRQVKTGPGVWPKANGCLGPSPNSIGGMCEIVSVTKQSGDIVLFAGTIPNSMPFTTRERVDMNYVHILVTYMANRIYPEGSIPLDRLLNFPISELAATPVSSQSVRVSSKWVRP